MVGVRRTALGALVVTVGIAITLALAPRGHDVVQALDIALQTAAAGAAALLAWRAAGRGGPGARSWRLLGAGAASWGLGNLIWAFGEWSGSGGMFPSLADVGFLALLVLGTIAMLVHPAAAPGRAGRVRLVVDACVAALSVRLIAWVAVLDRIHPGPGRDAFGNPVGFAYAVGHFVVVAMAVVVALRARGRQRAALLLVAAGFLVLGVGDGFFTWQVVLDTYVTGHPLDTFWIAGLLALAVAARVATDADAVTAPVSDPEAAPVSDPEERLTQVLLPYALVVPALAVWVIDRLSDGHAESLVFWNGVAIGGLVLVRQLVDRVTNVRLLASLQATVTELRTRDAQLSEAQQIAHLGSWEWDVAEGGFTWTAETVQIFGEGPPDPLLGPVAHLDADDRPRIHALMARAVELGETFRFDVRPARIPDRVVHVRGRCITDADGRTVRVAGTAQDVTTVRRLARELERRLAELERSNADLAHFAQVASHDLAAPVQVLLGHLRLLNDRVREEGRRDDAELVEGAIVGAQRLDELIQDILAYSLAASGEADLVTSVDADRVAREAARTVGIDQWAAHLEIETLPVVDAHPGQLRQLFQNLLSNAVKFVPPGRVPWIRVYAEQQPDGWCFSVADNGTGVVEDDRARIFHMFERGEEVDVRGTGIGLAICARIVARHGGRIWVDAGAEGGSVFRFTLPTEIPIPIEITGPTESTGPAGADVAAAGPVATNGNGRHAPVEGARR
jgi:signal transduction histidine kinase